MPPTWCFSCSWSAGHSPWSIKQGALRRAVDWLAERLHDRARVVIPVVCTVFALGGALENLQEEIVAMVPGVAVVVSAVGDSTH